jgi:hypothetical protein
LSTKTKHFRRIDWLSRSANSLAFGFGVTKAGPHPFLDERALKLSHGTDNLKHQPA